MSVNDCIRNDAGNWIIGYSKHIRIGIMSILPGFSLAIELNRNCRIEIETDSSQVVNLLLDYSSIFHPLDSLITNCRCLLSSFPDFKMQKVARQQNACVDSLVMEG